MDLLRNIYKPQLAQRISIDWPPFSTAFHNQIPETCDAQPLLRNLLIPLDQMPKSPPPTPAEIKSFVRNILLASPDFSRLYADVLISEGYNPNQARDIAERYQKKFSPMPVQSKTKSCTHIKVTGVRCGSPALRGEQFCYFHQRMIRTVKGPDSRVHHAALLEDEEAIQASIMEIVNALIRGTIDLRRGELILRALNTAVRNARHARFGIFKSQMIRNVPDFNEPGSARPAAEAAAPAPKVEKVKDRSPAPSVRVDPTQPKPPSKSPGAQILQQRKERAASG
jgi:hypothetical protein